MLSTGCIGAFTVATVEGAVGVVVLIIPHLGGRGVLGLSFFKLWYEAVAINIDNLTGQFTSSTVCAGDRLG